MDYAPSNRRVQVPDVPLAAHGLPHLVGERTSTNSSIPIVQCPAIHDALSLAALEEVDLEGGHVVPRTSVVLMGVGLAGMLSGRLRRKGKIQLKI
jgi:hypothetical protein